jgi:hypothetical protein
LDKPGSIDYTDVFSLRSLYEACKKEARERCTRLELFSHGADYTRGKLTHVKIIVFNVADPGCYPRYRIQNPDINPSRISDPGYNNNKRGGGRKICFPTFFFVATNITKL